MLYNTHLVLGIAFFLVLKDYIVGGNTVLFLLMVLLGSVLPDLDQPRSKISFWSGFIGVIVNAFSKHRGFLHSLPFFFVISFMVGYFWNPVYGLGLFVGCCAHLLGDVITPQGVKMFYPFSDFRLRGPMRVGSAIETSILIGLGLLIVRELVRLG